MYIRRLTHYALIVPYLYACLHLQGILDMLVLSQAEGKNDLIIHALKNNFEADAYFVKVMGKWLICPKCSVCLSSPFTWPYQFIVANGWRKRKAKIASLCLFSSQKIKPIICDLVHFTTTAPSRQIWIIEHEQLFPQTEKPDTYDYYLSDLWIFSIKLLSWWWKASLSDILFPFHLNSITQDCWSRCIFFPKVIFQTQSSYPSPLHYETVYHFPQRFTVKTAL